MTSDKDDVIKVDAPNLQLSTMAVKLKFYSALQFFFHFQSVQYHESVPMFYKKIFSLLTKCAISSKCADID